MNIFINVRKYEFENIKSDYLFIYKLERDYKHYIKKLRAYYIFK